MSNAFDWPESHSLLVDYMNSFYLNKEPDTISIRDAKNGNLREAAIFLRETCERDLRLCLQASQMPFDYWTQIFSVLQFGVLVSWIMLTDSEASCLEAAWSIIGTASETIKGIMTGNPKAGSFERGFLYELKGDYEFLTGETHRASDSYLIAYTFYGSLDAEDEEYYVLHPEIEPLFLQCDLIWLGKLDLHFVDSYDFTRNFAKRIEAKMRMTVDSFDYTAPAFV